MREFLLIGAGAVLGANLRYLTARFVASHLGAVFPYGTLFINITGSFLLGLLLTLVLERVPSDPGYALFAGTGFLGAYTTFSAFSYETVGLIERGDLLPALGNSVASVTGCVLAAYLGVALARAMG